MDLARLADPIDVEFLPKSVTESRQKAGSYTALAMPYLKGQAVLDHLDEVLGPENWQVDYEPLQAEHPTYLCRLSVKVGGEWISKSAIGEAGGDAESPHKAAQTDALKRAALAWGVGKFLQSIPKQWVECEVYNGRDGKPRFKKWTGRLPGNPTPPSPPPRSAERGEERTDAEGPQPSELELAIERMCAWFQTKHQIPVKRLIAWTGKQPSKWDQSILARFEKALKRGKELKLPVAQALNEEFGEPGLF